MLALEPANRFDRSVQAKRRKWNHKRPTWPVMQYAHLRLCFARDFVAMIRSAKVLAIRSRLPFRVHDPKRISICVWNSFPLLPFSNLPRPISFQWGVEASRSRPSTTELRAKLAMGRRPTSHIHIEQNWSKEQEFTWATHKTFSIWAILCGCLAYLCHRRSHFEHLIND